jgi:hypothetical protein
MTRYERRGRLPIAEIQRYNESGVGGEGREKNGFSIESVRRQRLENDAAVRQLPQYSNGRIKMLSIPSLQRLMFKRLTCAVHASQTPPEWYIRGRATQPQLLRRHLPAACGTRVSSQNSILNRSGLLC